MRRGSPGPAEEVTVMTAPAGGEFDLRQHADEIVRAASRAPSQHNAQPWLFRVRAGEVEVYADLRRRMPVADPADRQLFIGVGAAVYGVRLAVACLGVRPVVRLARDGDRPELAAVVAAAGRRAATEEELLLYPELERRRTARGPFTDDSLAVPLQVTLTDVAADEGAELRWVVRLGSRRGLAALAVTAEREQQSNPDFRAELARWVGPAAGGDAGVPYSSLGATASAGHMAEFPLRDFAAGEAGPALPGGRLEAHPGVAVLVTPTDWRADWLRAGQALHRLLLVASAAGISGSYLNQPLEIPRLRERVREELDLPGHAQLILRLGRPRGPLPPPTPRRPTADILLP